MIDDLNFLLKLQDLDLKIDGLRAQDESLENKVQGKTRDLESLKSSLAAAKAALQSRLAKRKELELTAEESEKIVKKHQAELNSLKSNDAYKAMLVEITNAKREVRKIEDEILEVMESIESAEKDYKAKEQKEKSEEGILKGEIQKLEAERSAIIQAEKSKAEERAAYAQTIPEKLRNLYEAIRQKRGTMVLVPIIESNCSGCRMSLTPNLANEVRKKKRIVRCETCSRIVYLPEEAPASPPPSDSLAATTS